MSNYSVKNSSGQVVSYDLEDGDPRREILDAMVKRGDLEKVAASTKSGARRPAPKDADAGVKDEKGDLLKSVHGGGEDPDADGDALGQPSGSKK